MIQTGWRTSTLTLFQFSTCYLFWA
jgi:hypothetical protein